MRIGLIIILLIIIYGPTFIWMGDRFLAPDSYYAHGFLIPLISGFLIWARREKLKQINKNSSLLGLWIVIGGFIIHLIGAWWRVDFVSGVSFIIVIAGLILYFFGKDIVRQLLFPLTFLIFMVPLPLVTVANINLKLKLLAAQLATMIINEMGISAVREGSIIQMMYSTLTVDNPCSGLKSLISLLALGSLFAYWSKLSKFKKILIFILSAPIAILANTLRVVFLCFISDTYGTKIAMAGFFHTFSGVLVFIFAFIGLIVIGRILKTSKEQISG